MWKCKHCAKDVDQDFDVCWNCGYSKNGKPPSKEVRDQLRATQDEQKADRESEQASRNQVRSGGNTTLTKCKECGSKISRKAVVCPSCGVKTKSEPGIGSKFFGSLVSLGILVWFGSMFLNAMGSSQPNDPQAMVKELEAKCAASAKDAPASWGNKKDVYESCVFGGKSQLRAQGLIQ